MKVSIRTLLTGPLLVLTIMPAAIVGGLFYFNSQKALRQTVEDLFEQISARTQNQLQLYLSTPHFINQINASAFEQQLLPLKDLDGDDLEQLEAYFNAQFRAAYQTGQNHEGNEFVGSINHVYVGTETGLLRGAEYRTVENLIATSRADISPITGEGSFEQVDEAGTLLDEPVAYDVRQRPWYTKGKVLWPEQEAGWSDPYCDQSTRRPAITAVRSVALNGEFLGVLGSDFLFDDIQRFLEELLADLNIQEGHILVLDERQSLMIAAAKVPGKASRSNASLSQEQPNASDDTPTQCNPQGNSLNFVNPDETIQQLLDGITGAEPESQPLETLKNLTLASNERYFWDTVSFEDNYGLKLSIAITIPEDNFTAQIQASTRNTVWLCLITLGIAGSLGIGLAQWMIKPVLTLEGATRQLPQTLHEDEALLLPTIENPAELRSLSRTFGSMATQLRELFNAFGHFVPQQFLTVLGYGDATQVKLGSYKTLNMTILFSDIRSFTHISESMTPEENFQFINDYLSVMEPAINNHHGFIDKYIGDAIMALFDGDRSPDNAVKAGLNMLKRLQAYNQTWTEDNTSASSSDQRPPLKIGIGIHTGAITLGTLGGKNRWDTTVIGREVNLASRLEGLTKAFGSGLLISDTTLAQLEEVYKHRYLGSVEVRGVDSAIKVYELYGADPEALRDNKSFTHNRFQVALEHYEKKRYFQSIMTFQSILMDCPGDEAAQFYIKQCQKHLDLSTTEYSSDHSTPINPH